MSETDPSFSRSHLNTNDQERLFADVMSAHQGILHSIAKTYCRVPDERRDLLQDMMLHIWRALPKYNGQVKITTWMYRIALNVAISAYRKRTSLRTAPLAEPEWDTQAQPDETHPSLQLLHRFIDELNEFDKALLLLYLEDKSHAEIAEILGISTSNVSTKIGRIKDKLKQRFEQVSEQNNLIK